MESTKYKPQYVGKAEPEFIRRRNNHCKDVLKLDAIPEDRHFAQKYHNFKSHAKFTISEQLKNIN